MSEENGLYEAIDRAREVAHMARNKQMSTENYRVSLCRCCGHDQNICDVTIEKLVRDNAWMQREISQLVGSNLSMSMFLLDMERAGLITFKTSDGKPLRKPRPARKTKR